MNSTHLPPRPSRERLLDTLPKIELHTHLAGNVPEWLFIDMARRHGIVTRNTSTPYDFEGQIAEFLVIFDQVADCFRTPEDLYRASYESLAEEARRSNLRYREVHFSPTINQYLPYPDAIAAITQGMEDARRDHGVDSRLIAAIYRSQGPEVAEKLVADVVAHPHPLVVGLGIEADDRLGPIEQFERPYAVARDAGLQLTAHTGERGDPEEVLYAIDVLGCRRLDHGYSIIKDRDAARRAADLGVHFATTWCSAAAHHGAVRNNPIRTMIDLGLDVSISSDDPGITRQDLRSQLFEAATVMELSDDYLIAQNWSQLRAAWIDDDLREVIADDLRSAPTTLSDDVSRG